MKSLPLALILFVTSGCVAEAFCANRQECNDDLENDSQAVCVEQYKAGIDSLRANGEEECQKLADAQQAFDACVIQLDCNDQDDADEVRDACGDELDDLEDAQNDARPGGEFVCSRFE